MQSLLKFYLEKSWLPLFLVALSTALISVFHPAFEKFDLLLILAAGWFLVRWNHSEEKSAEQAFITTVVPSRLQLLFVQFLVPALLLTVPFLVCIWTKDIYSWDLSRFLQAFLLSASLSGLSMRFTKPIWAILVAGFLYLVMSSEDPSFIFLGWVFVLMSYLAVRQVYGQRLPAWKPRLAAVGAAIAVVLLAQGGKMPNFDNIKISTTTNVNRGIHFGTKQGLDDKDMIHYHVGSVSELVSLSEEQLQDSQGLLQMFESLAEEKKHAMLEELMNKKHIPNAVLVAGLENKVFATVQDTFDKEDPCNELCDRMANYAAQFYDQYKNEDMKARYQSWLNGSDETQKSYVLTLAFLTKFHRHKGKVSSILDKETDNPMEKFRSILEEIQKGSFSLDGLINEEPEALIRFAETELKLTDSELAPAN